MSLKVMQALEDTLQKWKSMTRAENDEAESSANEFESSFYRFIDALREWFYGLDQRPQTLEEFLELPMIKDILDVLPGPLLLNFETEAELIVENQVRIEEDKYD